MTLDAYKDLSGYYFLSFYQMGHLAWSRRKLGPDENGKHARWWFWTWADALDAGDAKKHWTTGMLGDYDTEIFRYSPDKGTEQLTRSGYEPDDAQLEGLNNGRAIWTGLRLPGKKELPPVGPSTVNGSSWSQRDSWREIYARYMPVSHGDFFKSAISGFEILYGKNIDPELSEIDFNKNGKLDLGDIIYAIQKASGSR